MGHKDYNNICMQCLPIIRKVGEFIKQEDGKVERHQIETKSINSLVSYVDKGAEVMLVDALSKILPEAGFITEEETVEQGGKDIEWIIDPLDGTNNFLHGVPHYAISVGLKVHHELVVGIVLDPIKEELFYASKGNGAFLNDKTIRVSSTPLLKDSLVGTGFPYTIEDVAPLIRTLGHFMRYARGVRRMGAAALDLAYVACGRFDTYYETTLNAWDIAGGAVILTEAGGQLSDFNGGDDYLFGEQLIASNGLIHAEVLDAVRKNFRY
jgi:myo-inositol-1(or 4)-monophosphatase